MEGTAKIFSEDGYLEFEGSFVDGKRCGEGIEYIDDDKKGKEGEWKAGQLINGIIYDVILDIEGKLFLDSISQIDDPVLLYDLKKYSEEIKIGNVEVVNGQIKVIESSVKTVNDFLANNKKWLNEG